MPEETAIGLPVIVLRVDLFHRVAVSPRRLVRCITALGYVPEFGPLLFAPQGTKGGRFPE
jgi:hypothetical protein